MPRLVLVAAVEKAAWSGPTREGVDLRRGDPGLRFTNRGEVARRDVSGERFSPSSPRLRPGAKQRRQPPPRLASSESLSWIGQRGREGTTWPT
jgi:hypothetical protein